MVSRETLEEICDGCSGYCTLKELLRMSPMGDRMVVQLKMIEKFKWDWNQGSPVEMSWEEASKRFISEGYAQRFAELWDNPGDLYECAHHVDTMYRGLKQYEQKRNEA